MASKTPRPRKGMPPSRYLDRGFVEAQYARNLVQLNRELKAHLEAMKCFARIVKLARKAQRAGTTSPDVYRILAEAVRLQESFGGGFVWDDRASEVAVMAEILTGQTIVDSYTGDFVEPDEPHGSKAAWKARNALRLAKAETALPGR